MKTISKQELKKIQGGLTLTGTLINSISKLIEILIEAGERMGSAIRRIGSDSICPLQ